MLTLSDLTAPSKTAILVIDVQNDFCEPSGNAGRTGKDTRAAMAMIPTVVRFLDAAREHGTNVIFIQTIHEPATRVASYAYVNPLIALIVGVALGGEHVSALQAAGAAMIILGVVATMLSKGKARVTTPPSQNVATR